MVYMLFTSNVLKGGHEVSHELTGILVDSDTEMLCFRVVSFLYNGVCANFRYNIRD